ncbi:hypothetical protein RV12_GL001164 [Enterococcus quebecensis]|uniref:Uncharacterized protein n=1 Tax=Enterococcus quebecensis TaxID=903983 RepID=A0A1E5GWA7_9ENTE|nr:hypothetical protein BCR23_03005 [Enterococcus quebecensis]OJG75361.1 hypothetical protein RV12_GL001164 [Enterococcus quebecensis]
MAVFFYQMKEITKNSQTVVIFVRESAILAENLGNTGCYVIFQFYKHLFINIGDVFSLNLSL